MTRPKIFIFAPEDKIKAGDSHQRLEEAGCELTVGKADWHNPQGNNEDEMCAMAEGADALTGTSIRSSPITRRIMEAAPDLRIIAKYTIGVDDVDVEAATEMGILVTHGPTEASWGGVAEGTMAMILGLLKKTRERDERMKRGEWRDPALQGTYIGARHDGYEGITVGIVGLGRIGSRVCDLLAPWRVRLIAYDPYVDRSRFILHNARDVDYATLLAESDVVSFHVVLNRETTHMMGEDQFKAMKPSAVLINSSRGKVVDEHALAAALANDTIAGAAIDVYEDEPLAADSPLTSLGHKVMLSAHMVSANVGSGIKPGVGWATEDVLAALAGELPKYIFNKDAIPEWRRRFEGKSLALWPANR